MPTVTITVDNENVTGTVKDLDSNVTMTLTKNESVKINAKRILITLNANSGYIFHSAGGWNGAGEYVDFTISADGKTATLESTTDKLYSMLDIMTELVSRPEPPANNGGEPPANNGGEPPANNGVSGFNHLYLVDKTILKRIGGERFSSKYGENVIDLGQYILNILELPFEIDDSIKGLEVPIELGNQLLQTKAIELLDDELDIHLGEIHIPNKYGNVYDYVNTDIYLHLPFVEKIKLDVEYVINETVGIHYIIDLYSGETSINITSSKINGNIIHSQQIKIGRNIPFVRKNGDVLGGGTSNNGLNNNIYQPFIEVIRNKPYDIDNPFHDDIVVKTKLKDEKGYVIVENIILNSVATKQEKDQIINLLKIGVCINDL